MQENSYIPSSSERKRAITAYLLVGVLFFSGKEELTVFEYYHYKQAIGWLSFFVLSLLLRVIFLWLPIVKWLLFLPVLLNIVLWSIFVYSARKGEYYTNLDQDKERKLLYANIGGWILGIFDIKKNIH